MPGHLNERTLRDFQVYMYRFFGEDIQGLQKFVSEMTQRIEELEKKVEALETKRRPGRPKRAENEEIRATSSG